MSTSLFELNTQEKAEKGIEIEILHPKTNVPLGIFITVLGTDSETYRQISRKNQNRRLESVRRGRPSTQSAEEIELEAINTMAACTVSWRTGDVPKLELEPKKMFECNFENAKKLYSDPGFTWLRDQVNQEGGDRANFLEK